MPQNWFFGFHSAGMGFFEKKNFKAEFGIPFPIEKVIFIFVIRHPIPWKMAMSPKNYFSGYFGKYCFFGKIVKWKIFRTLFLTKKFTLIFVTRHPFLTKWSCLPINGFSQFFQHKLNNIRKVYLLESILIQKKILWRINFILIKFSANALLFEKWQNECKNP